MSTAFAVLLLAAAGRPSPSGEALLRKSCTTCHTLDSVKARKLSRGDWSLEVDKMVSMGAKIRNRRVLLDYLASAYGPRS